MTPTPVAELVLASASPRRRELLGLLGLRHRVEPADVDETPRSDESAVRFCDRAARDKARWVADRHPGATVLGADTVVEVDGRILGKPASVEDAHEMLHRLSGRRHTVHSSMALTRDATTVSLVDSTEVHFHPLDDALVRWYVASGEPMDKAGAYAVQGRGGLLVCHLEGSPHTVIGLPVHRLAELFAAAGFDLVATLTAGVTPAAGPSRGLSTSSR